MRFITKQTIRTLLTIAACSLGAIATGCANLGTQHEWEPKATVPALPVAYLEVPSAELPRHCGLYASGTLYGCAKRDFKQRTCTIVTGPQPAVWLLDHERKHCEGFDHGPSTPVGARTAALDAHPTHF